MLALETAESSSHPERDRVATGGGNRRRSRQWQGVRQLGRGSPVLPLLWLKRLSDDVW